MQSAAVSYLAALFDRCRRRFVEAARLVGADLSQWPNLNVVGMRKGVDLYDLLPFWVEICRRYVNARAETQLTLFDDQPSPEEAFSRYIHWELWPALGMDNGVVRAVLRATAAIPSNDPAIDGYYLVRHAATMTIDPVMVALDPANLDWT